MSASSSSSSPSPPSSPSLSLSSLPSLFPNLRLLPPKSGLVYSEKGTLTEILCKPKLLPIKSNSIHRIKEMEREQKREMEILEEKEREKKEKENGQEEGGKER